MDKERYPPSKSVLVVAYSTVLQRRDPHGGKKK
jgi:hypothetical protein